MYNIGSTIYWTKPFSNDFKMMSLDKSISWTYAELKVDESLKKNDSTCNEFVSIVVSL